MERFVFGEQENVLQELAAFSQQLERWREALTAADAQALQEMMRKLRLKKGFVLMRTITVALGEKTYNIEIAAGLLDQIGAKARVLSQAVKAAIISDSNVDPLYGERLERSLAASGFEVTRIVFAAGEQSKNLTVLGQVYDELARAGLTRSDLILTLGGGVPGDLGGFAAATFCAALILFRYRPRF